MSDVPPDARRPDDFAGADDDELADAILATFTSSIPIIQQPTPTPFGSELDDEPDADESAPEPEPEPEPAAEPEPEPEPAAEPEPAPAAVEPTPEPAAVEPEPESDPATAPAAEPEPAPAVAESTPEPDAEPAAESVPAPEPAADGPDVDTSAFSWPSVEPTPEVVSTPVADAAAPASEPAAADPAADDRLDAPEPEPEPAASERAWEYSPPPMPPFAAPASTDDGAGVWDLDAPLAPQAPAIDESTIWDLGDSLPPESDDDGGPRAESPYTFSGTTSIVPDLDPEPPTLAPSWLAESPSYSPDDEQPDAERPTDASADSAPAATPAVDPAAPWTAFPPPRLDDPEFGPESGSPETGDPARGDDVVVADTATDDAPPTDDAQPGDEWQPRSWEPRPWSLDDDDVAPAAAPVSSDSPADDDSAGAPSAAAEPAGAEPDADAAADAPIAGAYDEATAGTTWEAFERFQREVREPEAPEAGLPAHLLPETPAAPAAPDADPFEREAADDEPAFSASDSWNSGITYAPPVVDDEAAAVQPAPIAEPAPAEPEQLTEPAPTESEPYEPAPYEPAPTEPESITEPAPYESEQISEPEPPQLIEPASLFSERSDASDGAAQQGGAIDADAPAEPAGWDSFPPPAYTPPPLVEPPARDDTALDSAPAGFDGFFTPSAPVDAAEQDSASTPGPVPVDEAAGVDDAAPIDAAAPEEPPRAGEPSSWLLDEPLSANLEAAPEELPPPAPGTAPWSVDPQPIAPEAPPVWDVAAADPSVVDPSATDPSAPEPSDAQPVAADWVAQTDDRTDTAPPAPWTDSNFPDPAPWTDPEPVSFVESEPEPEPQPVAAPDPDTEPEPAPEPTAPEPTAPDLAAPAPSAPRPPTPDLSAFPPPVGFPDGAVPLPPPPGYAPGPVGPDLSETPDGGADVDRPAGAAPTGPPTPSVDELNDLFSQPSAPRGPSISDLAPPEPTTIEPSVPAPLAEELPASFTSDSAYSDDEDGSIDESDRASSLTLPPSFPAVADGVPLLPPPSAPGAPEPEVAPGPAAPLAAVGIGAVAAADSTSLVAPVVTPRLPRAFEVETVGVEPTPLDRRAGRAARLFWLWFAAHASVISLSIGGVLFLLGMSLRQAIVATVAGVVISALPIALGTLAGKRSGQPTLVVSRASFGLIGNILPSLIAVVARAFWGGALLWVVGTAFAAALEKLSVGAGLGSSTLTMIGFGIGALLVALVAIIGYGFVARVQLILTIVTALLVVGLIVLTAPRLDLSEALTVGDGPWILVLTGAVIVFSFVGLSSVHAAGDVARYQAPGSGRAGAGVFWAPFGAILPALALIVWGALLAASDAGFATELAASPIDALAGILPSWYPVPLLLAVALGALSSSVLSVYSGGFALQALGLTVPRSVSTLLAAFLSVAVGAGLVVLGTDATSLARDLITTIGVPVAAWAGLFAAETMIRRPRLHAASLLERGGVYPDLRIVNFLALLVISAIGLGLVSSSLAGLSWQGYLFPLLGLAEGDLLAQSDLGVLAALVLGLLVPLISAVPTIRRQEAAAAELDDAATGAAAVPGPEASLAPLAVAVPTVVEPVLPETVAMPVLPDAPSAPAGWSPPSFPPPVPPTTQFEPTPSEYAPPAPPAPIPSEPVAPEPEQPQTQPPAPTDEDPEPPRPWTAPPAS